MAQTMSLMESTDSRDSVPMRDSGSAIRGAGTGQLGADDFAQDRDLGEAGSHVVVQIAGNPRAQALHLEQSRHAILVDGISRCDRQQCQRAEEPPSLPDGRQDVKVTDAGSWLACPSSLTARTRKR